MHRLAIAAIFSFAGIFLAGCKTQQPPTQLNLKRPEAEESLASLQAQLQAANDRYNATCYPSPNAKTHEPFRPDDPACKQAQADYSSAMKRFNAAKAKAGAF